MHSGRVRPTASNLGYGPSTSAVANLAMIPVNNLGEYTCIYTSADAHLGVDFVGFIDAELTAPSTGGCPRDLAQIPPEPGGPMFNDREISFGEAFTITPLVADEYGIHLDQPLLNQLATQICDDFDAGVAARDIVTESAFGESALHSFLVLDLKEYSIFLPLRLHRTYVPSSIRSWDQAPSPPNSPQPSPRSPPSTLLWPTPPSAPKPSPHSGG